MTLRDLYDNVPDWVDPIKPCRDCGDDIRLISARLESGQVRTQIVDAEPTMKGWVRVWLNDRTASVRKYVGTVPGEPYLSFKRHRCDEYLQEGNET